MNSGKPGYKSFSLLKRPVKEKSGDLFLFPDHSSRKSYLFIIILVQIFIFLFSVNGIRLLLFVKNPAGLVLFFFSIVATIILWAGYISRLGPMAIIHFDKKNSVVNFKSDKKNAIDRYKSKVPLPDPIPFSSIRCVDLISVVSNQFIVRLILHESLKEIYLCLMTTMPARHLARHIGGIVDCDITLDSDDADNSKLPFHAGWQPKMEREKRDKPFLMYHAGAIIFFLLILVVSGVRFFQDNDPIWLYMGIHFQLILSAAGLVFFFQFRSIIKNARKKWMVVYLSIFSLFLVGSLRLPSRGLFCLILGVVLFTVPLHMVRRRNGRIRKTWIAVQMLALLASLPPVWYGHLVTKGVYAFFSQTPDNISQVDFFKRGETHSSLKKPVLTVTEKRKIRKLIFLLRQSISEKDPRRVAHNYLVCFTHKNGQHYFASIGKIGKSRASVSLTNRDGISGWNFGKYDNPRLIGFLENDLKLPFIVFF